MKEKSDGKLPRQVKVYQPNDHGLPPEDVEHIDSLAHRWFAAQTSNISDANKTGKYNPFSNNCQDFTVDFIHSLRLRERRSPLDQLKTYGSDVRKLHGSALYTQSQARERLASQTTATQSV